MGYNFDISRYSGMFSINHKIGKQHIIKTGLNADVLTFKMRDSVLNTAGTQFINRWDYKGQGGILIQPFFQWKYRITETMDFTAGLHAQYYSFSNALSPVEPRLGWKWAMKGNQKLFAGAGLHSQTLLYLHLSFRRSFRKQGLSQQEDGLYQIDAFGFGLRKEFQKRIPVQDRGLLPIPV
jgi:hypothetical protein